MALKPCKECGRPVSTKAKTCPGCGAPVPKGIGCLGAIVVIVMVFVIIGIISSASPPTTPSGGGRPTPPPRPAPESAIRPAPIPAPAKEPDTGSLTPDLKARVKFDGAQFMIANEDDFDWKDVTIELNRPGIFSGGFTLKVAVIPKMSVSTVGALQFADSDGKRFNPFEYKPKSLTIRGTRGDGRRAYYAGGWE